MLESWLQKYGYDIEPTCPSVQAAAQIRDRMDERCAAMHSALTDRLYDMWLARLTAYRKSRETPTA